MLLFVLLLLFNIKERGRERERGKFIFVFILLKADNKLYFQSLNATAKSIFSSSNRSRCAFYPLNHESKKNKAIKNNNDFFSKGVQ